MSVHKDMSKGASDMRETTALHPNLAATRRWIAERLAFERFLADASAEAEARAGREHLEDAAAA
jgi:hypothetical protein